jgi:hypothetical protein
MAIEMIDLSTLRFYSRPVQRVTAVRFNWRNQMAIALNENWPTGAFILTGERAVPISTNVPVI